MAEEVSRIDIGFQGGQVLPARVRAETHQALLEALADERSERWFELEAQESRIAVDLAQVVYVKVDTEAQRVGF